MCLLPPTGPRKVRKSKPFLHLHRYEIHNAKIYRQETGAWQSLLKIYLFWCWYNHKTEMESWLFSVNYGFNSFCNNYVER